MGQGDHGREARVSPNGHGAGKAGDAEGGTKQPAKVTPYGHPRKSQTISWDPAAGGSGATVRKRAAGHFFPLTSFPSVFARPRGMKRRRSGRTQESAAYAEGDVGNEVGFALVLRAR